jgi:hypothetical protein
MRTILMLLFFASSVHAQCCKAVKVQAVQKVVATKAVAVVPTQTLFLVAPPSYYGAPQYQAPAPVKSQQDRVEELLEAIARGLSNLQAEVTSQGQRIQALEGADPPVPPVPAMPLVIQQQCGMCHDGEASEGDFRLSDLTDPRMRARAAGLVSLGKMPRDPEGRGVDVGPQIREQLLAAFREFDQ